MRPVEIDGIAFKVNFWHERYDSPRANGITVDPVYSSSGRRLRGCTFGQIKDLISGAVIETAEAQCSWSDNFSKSTGRFICMERMLEPGVTPSSLRVIGRRQRAAIWQAYWKEMGYGSNS